MNCRLVLLAISFSLVFFPCAADDWPAFGGVRRDGASTEKGIRLEWGNDEPKSVWKAKVGAGYSSFIEVANLAYTVGNANGKNTIFCFDANSGEEKWTHSFPCEKAPKYFDGGSRATPAVAEGILYLASHEGAFFAIDAKTGKVLWSKDLIEDFNGRRPTWGFSGSPLVSDGKVIVDTGSKDGALVAMDAKTGDLVWRGGTDEAGYASPMLRANKPSEILVFNRYGLCSFLLADGKLLHRFQHKTRYGINVAQPVDAGNSILISSAYGKGSALVDVSGRTAKALWETESFSSQMASLVKKDNYAYGIHGQTGARAKYATLCCLDIRKGSVRWEQKGFGVGSVILVGGTLVILGDSGELALAEANPAGYMEKARFQVLGGKDGWTPPSYANGRLYCRSSRGDVVCLDMGTSK